jgi:hypothetical protein
MVNKNLIQTETINNSVTKKSIIEKSKSKFNDLWAEEEEEEDGDDDDNVNTQSQISQSRTVNRSLHIQKVQ